MNNVLELKRKSVVKPAKSVGPPPMGPRFFCKTCDKDVFKLYENTTIYCASCGAWIRNLCTAYDTKLK